MYVEGDVPFVGNNGNSNNGGLWGNDGIWAILLLALLGFGRFGQGYGGSGGGNSEFLGYELGKTATQADVASGFNNSAVLNKLNDIQLNQASNLNFINQGFSGLNTQLITGFNGVNNAICTLGYQNAQLINDVSHQISDCCCTTQRAIDGINYNNAQNTCNIIQAVNNGNQRIIDYLTSDKIDALNRQLTVAENEVNTLRNNAYLVNQLAPQARPAYLTCNPNTGLVYPQGNNSCAGCTI